MRIVALAAFLAAFFMSSPAAYAMEKTMVGDLTIETPWTRATPPRAKAGGAYLTITNTGSAEDRLIAGSTPMAGRVEIHTMTVQDGVMIMREVEGGLVIPAGGSVDLKPGGYHVMLMGLTDGLTEGETVDITLVFEKAGSVSLAFPVGPIGSDQAPHAHHGN